MAVTEILPRWRGSAAGHLVQDSDIVRILIDYRQIGRVAVGVETPRHQSNRTPADGTSPFGLEGAVAVGRHAIAVKVCDRNRSGPPAQGMMDGALEAALAVAPQDAKAVAPRVGNDEIGNAVASDVRYCHPDRPRADRIGARRVV